jgi:restriction system protein
MTNYYRVMLGRESIHAKECIEGNFIGTDFLVNQDLNGKLPDDWRVFNRQFIPIYLQEYPEKSKIAAGLGCGALWTVSKGIKKGDIVLSPDGTGHYAVGEVTSNYSYHPNGILPHRRSIQWFSQRIERAAMSEGLKSSTGSVGTVVCIAQRLNVYLVALPHQLSYLLMRLLKTQQPSQWKNIWKTF